MCYKIYWKTIGLGVSSVGIWGFVLPFLVSLPSTEMVILGLIISCVYFPIAYEAFMSIVKDFRNLNDNNKQEEK